MVAVLVWDDASPGNPILDNPIFDPVPGPGGRRRPARSERTMAVRPPARPAGDVRHRQAPEVYRRRRVAVGGTLVFLLLAIWIGVANLVGSGSAHPFGATRTITARSWVVQPGDTLWSIALASGATGDIRPLVDRLSAEVHGRPLQPGEVIRLP